jgi:alkylhydroperoxidase/carboxymuconolactone decarboxylase family protein YurZ
VAAIINPGDLFMSDLAYDADLTVLAGVGTTPTAEDFQGLGLITRTAADTVWARAGLDHRTRSAITLALLAGLGRDDELALHLRAALRNGLTPDEIGEVLLHTAAYADLPPANSAFACTEQVLRDEGAL